MPPVSKRRSHKKTRNGCSSCKKRHIKCDEHGPPCANCRARGTACDFLDRPEPPTPGVQSLHVESRLLELELLHRWSAEAHHTITFPEDNSLWLLAVTEDALQHEYLLQTIFAYTALYIAANSPPSRSRAYQLAALEYQNRAISTFHDQPSTQSLFAFSILNLVLAVAMPTFKDIPQASIVTNLKTVFQLLLAPVSIVNVSKDALLNGPFKNLVKITAPDVRDSLAASTRAAFVQLRNANDEAYRKNIESQQPLDAVRQYESYASAINDLEQSFHTYHVDGPLVSFRWLARIDSDFLQAVEKHEPVAVLITLYWAILLDKLGEVRWWAKSSGKLLVAELSQDLMHHRPEWQSMISWAHQQVGLPQP